MFLKSISSEIGEIVQIPPLLRQYEHTNSFKNYLICINRKFCAECSLLSKLNNSINFFAAEGRQTKRLIVEKRVTYGTYAEYQVFNSCVTEESKVFQRGNNTWHSYSWMPLKRGLSERHTIAFQAGALNHKVSLHLDLSYATKWVILFISFYSYIFYAKQKITEKQQLHLRIP